MYCLQPDDIYKHWKYRAYSKSIHGHTHTQSKAAYRTTDAMPFISICPTHDQGSIPSGAFERWARRSENMHALWRLPLCDAVSTSHWDSAKQSIVDPIYFYAHCLVCMCVCVCVCGIHIHCYKLQRRCMKDQDMSPGHISSIQIVLTTMARLKACTTKKAAVFSKLTAYFITNILHDYLWIIAALTL